MTKGSIAGNIIKFAFPLLLGNLFQQFYNMVDTWVIGQTGQNDAYAAVGSVGPIINILIGFFMGLSSGAGVGISQYYGAKKEDDVKRAVHTSLAMTLALAALFTVLGIAGTPLLLKLMLKSEGEIYVFAKEYLAIYFAGVSGLMIYNMGAGILRAVGDSKRPFYFLVVSAFMNVGLDFLFVFGFDMGAVGVAVATIVSQFVSAALVVITLLRSEPCIRLELGKLKIDTEILKKVIMVGIPAAVQMALTAFSNMFVQSYVANVDLGAGIPAETAKTWSLGAWTSYTKIDQFIFLPVQSIALAVTTFVAQNLGTNDIPRAKKGVRIAFLMAVAVNVSLIVVVMAAAPTLAAIFNDDENIVHYASLLLRYLTPFYFCTTINQTFSAAMRGAGNSRAPMITMLCSFVLFRQIYLFVMSNYVSNALLPIGFGYPAGWIMCSVITLVYYKFFFKFHKGRLV